MRDMLAKGDAMMTSIRDGQGTLGRLVASDELYSKIDKGADNMNVMLADVRAGKGTLGKLIYDPTLYDQAKEAMTNGNTMIKDAREGKGSLGKFITDDTLYDKLRETSANFASASRSVQSSSPTIAAQCTWQRLSALASSFRLAALHRN